MKLSSTQNKENNDEQVQESDQRGPFKVENGWESRQKKSGLVCFCLSCDRILTPQVRDALVAALSENIYEVRIQSFSSFVSSA